MSIFYDSTSLLNISRQQQKSVKQEVKMLAESYEQVYQNDLEEVVDYLISEGYDFSDYTWDDLYEIYDELKEASDYQQGRLFKKSGEPYKFQTAQQRSQFKSTDPVESGKKTSSASTQEPPKSSPGQLSLNLSGKKPSRSLPSTRRPGPEERRISQGPKRKPVSGRPPKNYPKSSIESPYASDFQRAVGAVGQGANIGTLKKYMAGRVPTPSFMARLASMVQSAQEKSSSEAKAPTQSKKSETRQERLQRLEKSGARKRVQARRDRKRSSGFSPSRETKQQLSSSGRYGKRTLGQKVKSLFRKEDIDLFDGFVIVLMNEGYNEDQIGLIMTILEESDNQDDIQECYEILENAIDGALVYQFMVENYEFNYDEDVYEAMQNLNEEDINYILDESEKRSKIDRRRKENKYASKYMN